MNKVLSRTHKGFSVVELVVILAIVGVIGGAGFFVYSQQADESAAGTETSETAGDVPVAPAISEAEDLDAAAQALDDTNLDASDADTQELDENLADI